MTDQKQSPEIDASSDVITLKEFLKHKFPVPQVILNPWLTAKSLNLIYAESGVDKSSFGLGIAYAVASGGEFLGWKSDKPREVLYLDGITSNDELQRKLRIFDNQNARDFPEENFRLMTTDLQKGLMPDLSTEEGQQLIDQFILPSTELIIVDSLSWPLVNSRQTNDHENWRNYSQWALSKRAQGKTIVFIQSSGKKGIKKGFFKHEDLLDTVIFLKGPDDYEFEERTHFGSPSRSGLTGQKLPKTLP